MNTLIKRAHVEECMRFYDTHPCSLHLFATGIGANQWEAMKGLATRPKRIIKCSQGSATEFERLAGAGISEASIVLDISAVITLSFLQAWNWLDSSKTYLVSQSTRDLVEQWIFEAREDRDREGGYAAVTEDNRFVFHEYSQAERDQRRAELSVLSEMIKKHCQSVSSLAVAEIPSDRRDTYEKFVGVHTLEALCLAKEQNAVLWTDDVVVGLLAKADFGLTTVWSQLALKQSAERGLFPASDFDLMSAKLAAWNYVSTVWNAATLISAGRHVQWDVEAWPLQQSIGLLSNKMPPLIKARIVLEFFRRLRQSDCGELQQTGVIHAILNSARDRRVVNWVRRNLRAAFPIDIVSEESIRLEIDYWLATHVA